MMSGEERGRYELAARATGRVFIYATPTDPDRRAQFSRVFGTVACPVTHARPELALVLGQVKLVFWIDVAALDLAARDRLVRDLAERFELSLEDAWADLPHGVPILAEDLIVTVIDDGD